MATATNSATAPNWLALVSEANLPEHRGTAFSLVALSNGIGRACGGLGTGAALSMLGGAGPLAGPGAYSAGLTFFVLACVPAGAFFFRAARSAPQDIVHVRATLEQRSSFSAPRR